jgi:hypothetical protein
MIYRKAKNAKVWFQIDGKIVCRVRHEFCGYTIYRGANTVIMSIAKSNDEAMDCTEAEFLSAYKIAKTGTDIEVTFI